MWGAGFTGLFGEDLVAQEAEKFRGQLGVGVYSEDPHSSEGEWRDVYGICLAWLRNLGNWIVWNANPGQCEDADVLAKWEAQYGLRPAAAGWTIEQRQARLRARILEPKGNNPAVMRLHIEATWGLGRYFEGLYEFQNGIGAPDDKSFHVAMYSEFWIETPDQVAELHDYLTRAKPMHLVWAMSDAGPTP